MPSKLLNRPLRITVVVLGFLIIAFVARAEGPLDWRDEFPMTDFDRRSVEYAEFDFDGATRDSIPPINDPKFALVSELENIGPLEPVLSIGINGDFRAYPLRILLWHEIVNDVVGGVPVLISYCPLCNSGVVFDRRVREHVLEFGNTGRLRHFDMVMYDSNTESWWQQFLGEALMGELTGTQMKMLPARLESLERFRSRATNGKVLVPTNAKARPYGLTPYVGMDSAPVSRRRFPYPLPEGVSPFARVVVVENQAWTLTLLRERKRVEQDGLIITWVPGQNSIHDAREIALGRDVGNVVVQRRTVKGLEDIPYDVSFAFAFSAFRPGGALHHQ